MPRAFLRTSLASMTCAAMTFGLAATAPIGQATAATEFSFTRVSTTAAYLNSSKDQTSVAEISAVSPDGMILYSTDAGGKRVGHFDISDPANPKPLGSIEVGGEPTSVYAFKDYVLVVVDSSTDFKKPSGHVSVLSAGDFTEVRRIDLGGQPDSIDVHGDQAVIAMENQRDEEAKNDRGDGEEGDLPQAPAGEIAFLDLKGNPNGWQVRKTALTGLQGLVEPTDPEPEYVKFSPDGSKVAVTLQENNAVVILDAKKHRVLTSWSAGEATVDKIDTKKDGEITFTKSITAPREPDSIGWVDNDHVATANEGDWKGGTRGWTVFGAMTGSVVWDAGNSFEYAAIRNGHWAESRAGKKGTEPEGLAIADYNGVRYAFVGSERSNFVAVYDVSNPAAPVYKQMLPSTNGPEGILPIPGRNLLAVSSEVDEPPVRATVALYQLGETTPAYPQLTSADENGHPIPWLAMGALAASNEAGKLYGISDNALKPNRVYSIDATGAPATITSAMTVTKDGAATGYDVEGIHAVKGGTEGFWLGVEGDGKETKNLLVRTDAKGVVQEEVELPVDVVEHLGKWGIEGVTGDPEGKALYVALQRDVEAGKPTRVLRYDLATKQFTTFLYELDATTTEGDWMGLSEITFVSEDAAGVRLAVIERDKLNGPDAKIKRIYEVTIAPDAAAGSTLAKKLAHDVLPDLQAPKGWTQEKLEGMTIDADGNVYVVTDNDGLKDNTGETVFLNLGKVFATETPAPSPEPSEPAPSPTVAPTQEPTVEPTQAPSEQPTEGPKPPKLPETGR